MAMKMEVPVIVSITPAAEPLVQHVVVPVIAVQAWTPNAFYEAPSWKPNAPQVAPLGSPTWMSSMGGFEGSRKRENCGYESYFPACLPSDGGSTKASSRESKSPASRDGSTSVRGSDLNPQSTSPVQRESWPVGCWPADEKYIGTRDVGSHVSIVLGNLPKMLCSSQCFAAALEQARLEPTTFEVKEGSGSRAGEAVLIFSSEVAAQRCIHHFEGMKWGRSRPIQARYCAAAGMRLLEHGDALVTTEQSEKTGEDNPQSQVAKTILKLRKKLREIYRLKELPVEQLDKLQRRKIEGEAFIIKQLADLGEDATRGTVASKLEESAKPSDIKEKFFTVVKKHWADYDEDEDAFGEDYQSTLAGSLECDGPFASDGEDF